MNTSGTDITAATPTPAELRANLEGMILADLVGPVGGEDEALASRNQSVRDRYLLGALAPRKTVGLDPERSDDPGIDGDGGADATNAETPAAKAAMFPSSSGMSFVLAPEATEFEVSADWGRYLKEQREPEDRTQAQPQFRTSTGSAIAATEPARVWQRYPMTGTRTIPLAEGLFGPLDVVAEQPEVVLRGRISCRNGYWLVTVFLVNEQPANGRTSTSSGCSRPLRRTATRRRARVRVRRPGPASAPERIRRRARRARRGRAPQPPVPQPRRVRRWPRHRGARRPRPGDPRVDPIAPAGSAPGRCPSRGAPHRPADPRRVELPGLAAVLDMKTLAAAGEAPGRPGGTAGRRLRGMAGPAGDPPTTGPGRAPGYAPSKR